MNDFTQHNQTVPLAGIIPPARTVTEIRHLNLALLSGDRAKIDAFADEMLRLERENQLKQITHDQS